MRSVQVRPNLALHDAMDQGRCDPVLRCESTNTAGPVVTHSWSAGTARDVLGSDGSYLVIGQFHTSIRFTSQRPLGSWGPTATLGDGVVDVLALSTSPQMLRVAASPVIARVADVQTRRDGAVRQFVSESVGTVLLPEVSDASVASVLERSGPRPAGIGTAALVDLGPETLGDRDADELSCGTLGACHRSYNSTESLLCA